MICWSVLLPSRRSGEGNMRGVKMGKNIDLNARRHTVMTNAGKHDKCCVDVQGGPQKALLPYLFIKMSY